MKVLVIPEDRTLDEDILLPVVRHIFDDLGRKARVEILADPHLRGVAQALDKSTIAEILALYPMIDLFLLIVDRDCESDRQAKLTARLAEAAGRGKSMFGCLAIEEVEVWALALHRDELETSWRHVRAHCHPKEAYFKPFAQRKNWLEGKGRGRAQAMQALAGKFRSLKSLCEEIQRLQEHIADWLAAR